MSNSVIYFNDSKNTALLLSNIKRDKNNNIVSGYVENGCWRLKISENVFKAMTDEGHVVNSVSFQKITEIPIPNDKKGDYNYLIDWALNLD